MYTAEHHFGKQIKQLRVERGISQEELSYLAEVHTSYVSKLERGTKSPTLGVILKIAKALDVSGAGLMARLEQAMLEEDNSKAGRLGAVKTPQGNST